MATRFSGIGNNPIEDSRNQEPDNISEGESQDEDPFKQVLTETAYIKQFVEEKINEPWEAIHEIEQRLNDLTLTFAPSEHPNWKCAR